MLIIVDSDKNLDITDENEVMFYKIFPHYEHPYCWRYYLENRITSIFSHIVLTCT